MAAMVLVASKIKYIIQNYDFNHRMFNRNSVYKDLQLVAEQIVDNLSPNSHQKC